MHFVIIIVLTLSFAGKPDIAPTLRDLANEVVPYVSSKWYHLGIQLDLGNHVLNVIKTDNHDLTNCCLKMFHEWLVQDAGASWSTLVAALNSKAVNEKRLAASLKAKFGSQPDVAGATHQVAPAASLQRTGLLGMLHLH